MRTRSLGVLVAVIVLIALASWLVFADGSNALADWFAELHGRPSGH